jgi:hypothetical protein
MRETRRLRGLERAAGLRARLEAHRANPPEILKRIQAREIIRAPKPRVVVDEDGRVGLVLESPKLDG